MNNSYYKKDKLSQLKGFCALVDYGSVIKAAEKLCVEPATISKRIKSLELDLGIDLFNRENNKLILNEIGKKFYKKALNIIQSSENLYQEFAKEVEYERKNTLKIAGHHTVLSCILPKYLRILKENDEFKEIKIQLLNIAKKEALEQLKEREIDIAIYPVVDNEKNKSEFNYDKFFKYRDHLVIPKNHPLSSKKDLRKEDFKKYPILLLDKFSFYDPKVAMIFGECDIKVKNSSWEIIFGLLKENLGITGMTKEIFNKYKDSIKFITKDISHFFPDIYYTIITRKNFTNKISADFLIRKIKEDYKDK